MEGTSTAGHFQAVVKGSGRLGPNYVNDFYRVDRNYANSIPTNSKVYISVGFVEDRVVRPFFLVIHTESAISVGISYHVCALVVQCFRWGIGWFRMGCERGAGGARRGPY